MSSPTVIAHPLTDADAVASTISAGLSGVTLAGFVYFQAYGTHGGADSTYTSNVIAWGDTTAPVITTSGTQSAYEGTPLAVALTATDTGGVPALLSDGTTPGWYISGGADQTQFQIAIVSGVPTLQWINNGTQIYANPNDAGSDNVYNVSIKAVDYSGNQSSPLAMAVTNNAIAVTPFTFNTVNNAPLSTLETSNTIALSITPGGLPIAGSLAGTGFTLSKNGGAYQGPGSLTAQRGDTLTLEATSPSANNLSEVCTVTVGSYSTTWRINAPVTTTGFNPSDKSGNVTLSNAGAVGYLTAANGSGGSGPNPVRTVASYTSGNLAVGFHVNQAGAWMGFTDGAEPLNNFPTNSFSVAHDGSVFIGTGSASNFGAPTAGDDYILAIKFATMRGYLKRNGTWHSGCGDPNAAGAGFDLSSMTNPQFGFALLYLNNAQTTLQAVTLTGFTSVI